MDIDEIPGNAGMLDQIEALRWINKFIRYFGGDPACVTIVGESAGGASTSFLLISPPARGKSAENHELLNDIVASCKISESILDDLL